MIKGQCLCSGIVYHYDGEITELALCHCQQCKMAQGTAFGTNAPIESELFRIIKGEQLLSAYFSSRNKKRVFCSCCGSPLYSQRTDIPEIIRLRVGTITEGSIPEPGYQSYYNSKSEWMVLNDDRPKYPFGNPG